MRKKLQCAKALMMVGLWFIVWPGGLLLAKDLSGLTKGKKYHPKMESILGMLADKYSQGRGVAREFAYQRKIPFQDDQVTVILVPPLGMNASAIDEGSLSLYGATVEAVSRHLIRARIPISRLVEIAENVAGVSYIRLSLTPLPGSVISEGVALTNAVGYHSAGYEGQNTKVAVIDLGFNELEMVQNAGELPSNVITKDFTGTGLTTGSNHGTKIAEIVYDMAPRAQLSFIKIADEVDLENAKDYCITEGEDIINHSWGWPNTNFTDGTGLICDIANDAQSHNILWANAAGNAAREHYQDFFTDVNSDSWHEFAPGDETNPIQVLGDDITIFLTWDAWPTTKQDYDLYLYDSDFNLVASSTNAQTGTQPPTEKVVYTPSYYGTYNIMIHKFSATGNEELKLFTFNCDLQYHTPAYSLWPPADATGVMSAGAIDQANWETGPQESYSSQGPTNDGRVKPDISGPDGVSRYAGGSVGRGYGTSYAAPHVAGAASLLLSRYPTYTADQLQLTLENWAVDMGTPGKDDIYGYGRLMLEFIPGAPPSLSWTGEPNYTSDGLDPEIGTSSTNFTYRVKYSDEDNDPPASGFPKVHILKGGSEISGSPFTMGEVDSGDITYSDGKLYTYTKNELILGTDYDYRFEAEDVHGSQATGDPINVVDGPDISEEIPVLEVDPASLAFGEVKVPQTKTMTFRAYNTGTEKLSGTISDDRDWITVDPTSLTENDNNISVTVDTGIMDAERWKEYSGTVTVTSNGGTKTVGVSVTPTCVKVYPNPFNPGYSRLTFWGSGVPHATIKIYTVSGELVKSLHEINGEYKIYWDGENEEGKPVVAGIYLFVANNAEGRDTGKFMVIRKP